MKFGTILLSAFFAAALFDAALAESKATRNAGPSQTANPSETANPSQAASATTASQAMRECEALYGGGLGRGHLGRDRYAYIERCFKDLTGMYPSQVNQDCSVPRC
jgi:hypothetical protein